MIRSGKSDPMIPSDDPIQLSDPGFVDAELK